MSEEKSFVGGALDNPPAPPIEEKMWPPRGEDKMMAKRAPERNFVKAVERAISDPARVTAERNSTHGDWGAQANLSHQLKETMRQGINWSRLSPAQAEALDMIQAKVSRILTGNPDEPDHWADIKGYAHLAEESL